MKDSDEVERREREGFDEVVARPSTRTEQKGRPAPKWLASAESTSQNALPCTHERFQNTLSVPQLNLNPTSLLLYSNVLLACAESIELVLVAVEVAEREVEDDGCRDGDGADGRVIDDEKRVGCGRESWQGQLRSAGLKGERGPRAETGREEGVEAARKAGIGLTRKRKERLSDGRRQSGHEEEDGLREGEQVSAEVAISAAGATYGDKGAHRLRRHPVGVLETGDWWEECRND